ncbi:MAG: P-II family nitrogen regulator [Alphaproteobacteria bacterium]
MKEIKALIHRGRVSEVIRALKKAGCRDITVVDVKGMLRALGDAEQDYSVELGEKVITEAKVEFVCEDDRVDSLVALIKEHARTGQDDGGWIYVSDILAAHPIHKA